MTTETHDLAAAIEDLFTDASPDRPTWISTDSMSFPVYRRRAEELAAAVAAAGLDIGKTFWRGSEIVFDAGKGGIAFGTENGFQLRVNDHKTGSGRSRFNEQYPTAGEAVEAYIKRVPAAYDAHKTETDRREAEKAARTAEAIAVQQAHLDAFAALSPDMKTAFRTILEVIAIQEDEHRFAPPIAATLCRHLDAIEKDGLPKPTGRRGWY